MNIPRLLRSAESVRQLDGLTGPVQRTARRLLDGRPVDRLLRGSWLGHPVHPMLVTVPIGAWVSAAVLDLGAGSPQSVRRLIALGLLATPPTVATGLADWSELTRTQRRVGAIHAAANVFSAGCFLASYRCRARDARAPGIAWSALGLLVVGVAGALGGHLTYAQGASVDGRP